MRFIIIALLFLFSFIQVNANNDFLTPDEAFKINISENIDSVNLNIDIDDTIYLYDDKLKVFINDKEVTKNVIKNKPVNYADSIVHFGNMNIILKKDFIKKFAISNYTIKLQYQGCSKKGLCYAPMEENYKGNLEQSNSNEVDNIQEDETTSIANKLINENIFTVLGIFFIFGLALSLTPCIFPMIPILSSIIIQHSNDNEGKMSASHGFMLSLVYVLSMSLAYTLAGVLAGLFGANISAMLQNPIVLIIFSAVFVALAFSLFGYYSLELPQSFQNKINNITGDGKKGFASVAIMGFLSALIVGPCVAPPLAGALLYIGQTGDAFLGGLALFIMSIGLGVPLLIMGIGAGKYMPKPGGWMNTVSKAFGVVMLALAIYMLDRLLPQYIIYILFAILSIGTSIYLIKNSNKLGKILAAFILILGTYFIYLSVNIQKANLNFQYVKTTQELNNILKNTTKPIMLDYWASWCVSCKELELITFKDKRVEEILKSYLLLKVDVSKNTKEDQELMKKFNIFGPPALVFFDKNGKELKSKKMIGYKSADDFLEIINK